MALDAADQTIYQLVHSHSHGVYQNFFDYHVQTSEVFKAFQWISDAKPEFLDM